MVPQGSCQHYAAAQRNIGVLYVYGHGVPLDNVQALMWWLLAADGGDADAITSRDIIAKQMTPKQIAKAKRLAQKWLAAHPKPKP